MRWILLLVFGPVWAVGATGPAFAEAHAPRVLLMQSYGAGFAPFSDVSTELRAELSRRSPVALDFYEVPLDVTRSVNARADAALLAYLRRLFDDRPPDLVVTVGAPAARFAQTHREALFPSTPLIAAALDRRWIEPASLAETDTVVAVDIDVRAIVETMLEVQPETRQILVVLGSSPQEHAWRAAMERDLADVAARVSLDWTTGMAVEEILERVAALPREAAVFYGLFAVDGNGVPQNAHTALPLISEASAAPVFGFIDAQLGEGILGGRLLPFGAVTQATVGTALALLAGEPLPAPSERLFGLAEPSFDSRQLARFGIAASDLPAGSRVLFREETVWDRHRGQILGALGLMLVQAAFIAGLVESRRRLRASASALTASEARLRDAAAAARDFAGRLIHAQEDERSRLSRELHDDVTQRLAALALDAGRRERLAASPEEAAALASVRAGLARLSGDVHALSYRLHPSILADLGLAAALESECERVTTVEGLPVAFAAAGVPDVVPPPVALCVFRVAQEALRNVVRHARAARASVTLTHDAADLVLTVEDDGIGFAADRPRPRPSLGLASMRQRVLAVEGALRIDSGPGKGTRVELRVPTGGAPCGARDS